MAQSVFYIAMCVTERETVRMDQMNKDAQTHADKVSLQTVEILMKSVEP